MTLRQTEGPPRGSRRRAEVGGSGKPEQSKNRTLTVGSVKYISYISNLSMLETDTISRPSTHVEDSALSPLATEPPVVVGDGVALIRRHVRVRQGPHGRSGG